MTFQRFQSPVGTLGLFSNGTHLTRITFGDEPVADGDLEGDDAALTACAQQLTDYFAGRRRHFDLPLAAAGTAFQRSVWSALFEIPYGALRSYGEIAQRINKPRAVRAVGAANGRNPLPIVVPCHRVIGSDGSLTGFVGGLEVKRFLLELEGSLSGSLPTPMH
jgi:methylated-DNA-[protein]-cysteine S-methyltransferase